MLTFATSASKEQSPPTLAKRGSGNGWPVSLQKGVRVQALTSCAPNVMFSGSVEVAGSPLLRKRRTSLRCTPVSRLMRLSVGALSPRRNSRSATSTKTSLSRSAKTRYVTPLRSIRRTSGRMTWRKALRSEVGKVDDCIQRIPGQLTQV
ncbi:hypothetical protein D3C87_1646540 [compost metagenome]